jgi:hypothetical protein
MTNKITITYHDHEFEVEVTHSPIRRAKTNCTNEDSRPAEGGLEEVLSVALLDDKGAKVVLPEFLQDCLDSEAFDGEMDVAINDALEAQ